MIINARWVVPVIPANTVYENYSIVIDNERIVDILPTSVSFLEDCLIFQEVEEKYTSENVIDRKQHVVMPGLINMHTHAAMSLFKGYSDDKSLVDWLRIISIIN